MHVLVTLIVLVCTTTAMAINLPSLAPDDYQQRLNKQIEQRDWLKNGFGP